MRFFLIFIFLVFIFLMSASASYAQDFVWRTDGSGDTRVLERVPEDSSSLKVFWWNIACSSTKGLGDLTTLDQKNVNPQNAWQNLLALIKSPAAPDLIVLGEYCPYAFDQATYDQIVEDYPHKFRIVKMSPAYGMRNGMRVFSRLPLDSAEALHLDAGDLSDFPIFKDCAEQIKTRNPKKFQNDYWARDYAKVQLRKNDAEFTLLALHLSNPWRILRSCSGKLEAGLELARGELNPNYVQVQNLVETHQETSHLVALGDFNAPKNFFGSSDSASYNLLSSVWGESLVRSNENTFIDLHSSFGSYSIDHAFTSSDLSSSFGEVVPFAGSDHLPIYILVE